MFFQNFIKTGFRFLWKTRRYSFLNILGLTLGVTMAGYTWLFVSDQFSYDSYHEHADHSYRIAMNLDFKGEKEVVGGASYIMGEEFKKQIPGIVASSQVKAGYPLLARGDETAEFTCHFVNNDLFKILDFEFHQGGPGDFGDPSHVLVSRSFFQNMDNPETVEFIFNGENHTFQVTGIFEDQPHNSSFQPEVLVSTAFYPNIVPERRLKTWLDINMNVLLRLEEGTDPVAVANQMSQMIPPEEDSPLTAALFLQPIANIHTNVGLESGNGLEGTMDRQVLLVLAFTSMLCLLISTLNFANFSVGNYLRRVKEVGIRKTIGADRQMIFSQFLVEVSVSVVLASALGMILQLVFIKQFSGYIEQNYAISSFWNIRYLAGMLVVAFIAILLAGIVPATFLSRLHILKALRGYKFMAHRRPLSKLFLSFQAALSVFMLLVTFTTQRQLNYMLDFDLGYNADNLIYASLQRRENAGTLKNELLKIPGVDNVSFNSGYNGTRLTGNHEHIITRHLHIDPDFLEMLDLKIVMGRNLDPEIRTDEMNAVLINETMVKALAFEEVIGATLPFDYGDLKNPTIVGVVQDYHFFSPRYEKMPLVMYFAPIYPFQHLFVQTSTQDPELVASIASVYEKVCAPFGFDFRWMSEYNKLVLDSESKVSKVSFIGSVLAIFLSSLGLLGVLGTNIEKRLKEITIHKINGASTLALYNIFFRNFLPWLALGLVVGIFPAFQLLNNWLDNFAHRIQLGAGVFLAGIALCAVMFLVIMLVQLLRINRLNPVMFLRDE